MKTQAPEETVTATIEVAGENALIVYLGETTSAAVSAALLQLAQSLKQQLGCAIIGLTPSYASLLINYDLLQTDAEKVTAAVKEGVAALTQDSERAGSLVVLPVYYSPEVGLDLVSLAQAKGLTTQALIAIHQQREYRVYAIGFAPGFAYLGDVDERIAAPRLATPRQHVPRGAVAIAERQTAVYPAQSPGGWNIIGRCPLTMFDPTAAPPMPVQVGDRVQFEAISREQFLDLGGEL